MLLSCSSICLFIHDCIILWSKFPFFCDHVPLFPPNKETEVLYYSTLWVSVYIKQYVCVCVCCCSGFIQILFLIIGVLFFSFIFFSDQFELALLWSNERFSIQALMCICERVYLVNWLESVWGVLQKSVSLVLMKLRINL